MSKMIGFRVPATYTYTGNEVKNHLDNFFQWMVNNPILLDEMQLYPEWELIEKILGGWK